MESVNRVTYSKESAQIEGDVSFTLKQTINQGLNDGGVLVFRIPPSLDCFTDLNSTLLKLDLELERADEADLTDTDQVNLDGGGMHSLFSSCEVRFNEKTVSTMSHYPLTTQLSRYLGGTKDLREYIWDGLDGTWDYANEGLKSSDATSAEATTKIQLRTAQLKAKRLHYGRLYSDVLMSSRQYLPPGVALSIFLRRAPDNFSLVSHKNDERYVLTIHSASLYVRRNRLPDDLTKRVMDNVRGGDSLTFNRLESRLLTIPRGSEMFLWPNLLNGAELPNRIYVTFIAHASLYGTLTRHSTYFENLGMKSLNMKLSGRDLMVDPIKTSFTFEDGKVNTNTSEWREGLLSLAEAFNQLSDQTTPLRITSDNFIKGLPIYAIELSKCGQEKGNPGSLDLELTFDGTPFDACVVVFSEKTDKAPFEPI